MDWFATLDFGKYKGRTYRYVYYNDRQYLVWLCNQCLHDKELGKPFMNKHHANLIEYFRFNS